MKRIFVLLLACIFITGSAVGASAVVYGEAGYLTEGYDEASAWEIDSIATLIKMRDDVNSGKIKLLRYYKLTADLDISGYTDWEPIGQDSSYPFRGHFDGNEHTVTVKMTRTDMGYTGLFGYVEGGGIKNLSIAGDVKTSSQTTSGKYFSGGIAACISGGTIDNCKFEGKLIMSTTNDKDDLYAGGIAGRVSDGTTITNSRVDGTINVSTLDEGKSSLYAGGITGYIYGNATVSSCRFDGEISVLGANIADSLYAGGIAGYAYSEGRKYSEGSPVTLNKNSVGKKNSSTVVKALYSFSNNPNTYAGGIVGILYAYSWDSYSNYDYGRGEKAFFSVTGNYSRLKTQAGHTDMLTYGNIYRSYYVHDNSYPFSFSDNKEYDPDEYSDPEPDPETAAPVITTSSLPSGTVDVPYSFEFEANGEKPITWTAEGTLPEGLEFKDGKLTGTPTAAGSFKLTVTATNDFDSAAKDFTLTIASVSIVAKPVITTESLPDAKVGESYSAELSATSDEQVKWSAEGLPAGLELDESTGAITGIPTEAGTFTVKVTAENTGGAESKELTLVVEEPSAPPAPMVIETSKWERENGKLIVETTAGERYEFEALEGTDGYGFVINGELPGGLVINLPEMWGLDTDKSFAVTVADGDKIVEASEVPGLDANACRILGANIVTLAMPDTVMTAFQFIAPSITTAEDLGTFTADMDISIQLKAEGTTWRMKWSAENLPDVLNIGEDGLLSGSIAAAGEYSFTAKVENVAGEDSRTFKLTVKAAPTRPVSPVITTAKNLGTFKVGEEVSIQLEATGTTPITWLKTDGTLPDGLVVDSSGLLSGTLTKAGKYTFLVSATNEVGSVSRGFTMTVESNIQVPSITSAQDLGTYEYEADVDKHIEATGTTPITWSMSGNPSWLEIDSETGDITGTTPKKSGEFTFTVTASNSGGKDSRKFTLKVKTTVAEVTAPTIKTDSLPNGTNGEIYNATLDADGSSPITWAATGLPDGLSLNASGKLTGVPKVGGNFTVVVTAENSAGNDTKEYTLTIAESNKVNPPKITTDELSDATVGDEYNVQFTAEGKDITWTATWKALTGFTFTPDGVLRGTPTASGTFNIVVKAKNKAGTDYANLTLKVNDKPNETVSLPEVKSSKIPDAYQDEEYSYFLEATGTGLKWSLAEPDSLPKGLELTEDGEITGRVDTSKATTFKFKVIASNSAGSSPAKQISLKVVAKTPTFKSDALKEAKWNKKYSFTLKVQNMKPTVWGIEGDLPEGVKFDKGKFSGKPTEAGEFDLTISASNGAVELSEEFTLVVKGVTPKIKGSFKKGTEGEPYKSVLKATGVTPLTWYFEDLPDGLDYTTNETGEECTITGTPEGAFNSKIQVTVENGSGDDQTAGKGIKMTIKAVKPKITTAVGDIPDGTVGKRYSYQLKFSPATAEVLWSYTGDMPEGLRLDEDSGVIEGVPEEAGTNFKITVKVENVNKASYKSTRVFYITINPAEPATDKPEEPEEPEAPEFENGVAYHERGELTAETLAVIAGNDEVIAAVLPALEVEEAGLYEFTVSLDVNAPVDGLLVWHSFPNGEDDENDAENAVFLNEDGETIERVPETYSVTVSAWLEPGIIYEPIIAVRIKD